MSKNEEIFLKPATEYDFNFILSAWTTEKANWVESKFVPKDIHIKRQEKILSQILSRGSQVMIACLRQEPDTYLGYILFEKLGATEIDPTIITHFVYCKKALRRQGVARLLLEGIGVDLNKPILASCAAPIFNKQNIREKYSFIVRPEFVDPLYN